jgi:hypothetical protein
LSNLDEWSGGGCAEFFLNDDGKGVLKKLPKRAKYNNNTTTINTAISGDFSDLTEDIMK